MLKGYGIYSVQANTLGKNVFVPRPEQKRDIKTVAKADRAYTETADVMGSGMGGGNTQGYGMTGGALQYPTLYNTLSGFLPSEESNGAIFRKLYKDLYNYDAICGSAVDLKANLPFSDFTLTGVKDPKRLEKYLQSVENILITKQLPVITVDYYALGAFLGSLNFDENRKIFTSMMAHDLDTCEFTWLPFAGMDPIIDVNFGENLKKLLASKDPRLQQVRQMLPDYILQGMKKGKVELSPSATLFVPRRGLSSEYKGHSIYRRVLAIHLVEKAIIKGTIDRAMRRQSPILQLVCGDENWTPSTSELTNIANLFRDADMDPVNAIVATRTGINPTTVKNPEDFWKWTDIFDFATHAKLNALGINESFLSGDATYSTMEVALSVFTEDLKVTRSYMESEIFYDKMFPAIAVENDFKINPDKFEETGSVSDGCTHCFKGQRKSGLFRKNGEFVAVAAGDLSTSLNVDDITNYEIPSIHWHKQLSPIGDENYFNVLGQLQEVGLPIPLSMWAAAGGLSLEDLMSELEEDKKVREKLSEITGMPQMGTGEDMAENMGMGDDMMEFSHTLPNKFSAVSSLRKKPILSRKFDDTLDPRYIDSLGRHHSVSARQKSILKDKINKEAAHALSNLAEKRNQKQMQSDSIALEQASTKVYPMYNRNLLDRLVQLRDSAK